MQLHSIHCYPVKGLAGTALPAAALATGGLAFDRRFGIALADSTPLLAGKVAWHPWRYFISLKKNPAAALITASATGQDNAVRLTLQHKNGAGVSGNPEDTSERWRLEEFLRDMLALPAIHLIDSRRQPLWDESAMPLSLVNIETVAALEKTIGRKLQTARFRANLLFGGANAWCEQQWCGTLAIGTARLAIAGGIPRCAATMVNPDSAVCDCNVPQLLMQQRQNNMLGIFAAVQAEGEITVGMEIDIESAP